MSSLCSEILNDFGSALGLSGLSRRPWYLVTGRGGPNAALKVVLPPQGNAAGYVLTIVREPDSAVVAHEVETLNQLESVASSPLADSLPRVLAHGSFDGCPYFGVAFYGSHGQGRVARRLARKRRYRWVVDWTTQLALATRGSGLSRSMLESEYLPMVSAIRADPAMADDVKRRVERSLETLCDNAANIPSVCSHGDLWAGNILWQRGSRLAIILDWGAARWPGLPCVDLCRFASGNSWSDELLVDSVKRYCHTLDIDPTFVPALYDLYNAFVKAELDLAYATQPHAHPLSSIDVFRPDRLSRLLGAPAASR